MYTEKDALGLRDRAAENEDNEQAEKLAREAIRSLIKNNTPRTWTLTECGYNYKETVANSLADALAEAVDNVDRANYDSTDRDRTLWVTVAAECELTGESGSEIVTVEPDEPDCSEQEHDWCSDHAIVGGLKENPGVWGKGAGVIIHEVCRHCRCARITDTWSQCPETGQQGFETVRYDTELYVQED